MNIKKRKKLAGELFNKKLWGFEGFAPDSEDIPKIKFKGKEYLLVSGSVKNSAIATKEQFENFECSYAHLYEDGKIRRFGGVIGNIDDIEFL